MNWKSFPDEIPPLNRIEGSANLVSENLLVRLSFSHGFPPVYTVGRLYLYKSTKDDPEYMIWDLQLKGCGEVTHFCEITEP